MTARIFIGPALALFGRATGLHTRHFVGALAALAVALCVLAAPFWLLAEAAAPALGMLATVIAIVGYATLAAALIAASAVLAGRVVLSRLRRGVTLR